MPPTVTKTPYSKPKNKSHSEDVEDTPHLSEQVAAETNARSESFQFHHHTRFILILSIHILRSVAACSSRRLFRLPAPSESSAANLICEDEGIYSWLGLGDFGVSFLLFTTLARLQTSFRFVSGVVAVQPISSSLIDPKCKRTKELMACQPSLPYLAAAQIEYIHLWMLNVECKHNVKVLSHLLVSDSLSLRFLSSFRWFLCVENGFRSFSHS